MGWSVLPLFFTIWAAPGGVEVFHLGEGREIRAEAVKETGDSVFVDLGWTVLALPKKEIVHREAVEVDSKSGGSEVETPSGSLYCVGRGPERSVKENVDRTSGAVVLVSTPSGLGSGFLISKDGYVITNDHVIHGETQVTVTLFEKTSTGIERRPIADVRIVAMNAYADLALLKIESADRKEFPFLHLAEAGSARVGDGAYAIGNPLGLERSVSEGILSSMNRPFDGLTYLQTTTQVNPGNSGGPLFDLCGHVIGVTNMKLLFTEGLSFAIPVDRVKWFLENREAFLFDKDNPNTGYRYLQPPTKDPGSSPAKPPPAPASK
jgi:serine protease Do